MDMLMSTADRLKVYNSVKEMLCYVCDFAHDRCVKLMLARGKVSHHKVVNKTHTLLFVVCTSKI